MIFLSRLLLIAPGNLYPKVFQQLLERNFSHGCQCCYPFESFSMRNFYALYQLNKFFVFSWTQNFRFAAAIQTSKTL